MNLQQVGYGLLCVAAPLLWGLLIVWISNRVEQRIRRSRNDPKANSEDAMPPIDYHI